MTSINVHYGRRQTDKLPDGSFDAIELSGEFVFEADDNEDPFALFDAAYKKLAEKVESKLAEYSPREYGASGGPRPVDPADSVTNVVNQGSAMPDTGSSPAPAPEPAKRGWIEDSVQRETGKIQERVQAMPGETITPRGDGPAAGDEYGTPTTSAIVPNEAVMYGRCRVFDVEAKKASNGNPFISIRIGKRGEDGIPGQYTTARSFEADVIKQVAFYDPDKDNGKDENGNDKPRGGYEYKIREADYVDVWGYFKPWKGNDQKFDLELQKIQLSEDR